MPLAAPLEAPQRGGGRSSKRRSRPLAIMAAAATALVLASSPTACLAFRRVAAPASSHAMVRFSRGGGQQQHMQQHPTIRPLPQQHRQLSLLARLKGALASSLREEEVDPGVVEGTDLRIVKYPDPRLRAPNAPVTEEEFGPELQKLAKDMFKLMYAANGVGLAAPQVGVNKRLMVFNPDGDKLKWLSEVVLVNPQIVEKSGKTDVEEEGCLSFPGMAGDVERSLTIKVTFQDAKGRPKKKTYREWEARIFQHEYDHLDGVVYIDRLSPEGREKVQPVLDKLIAEFGPGGAL